MQFTDAEFMTAQEKALVYKQWQSFIDWLVSGKREEATGSDYGYVDPVGYRKFSDRLYKHLSLHCGFIAHYNRAGFFSEYFMDGQDTQRFFDALVSDGGYGDTQDLTQAMIAYYQEHKHAVTANVSDEIDQKFSLIKECVRRAETDNEFKKQIVARFL